MFDAPIDRETCCRGLIEARCRRCHGRAGSHPPRYFCRGLIEASTTPATRSGRPTISAAKNAAASLKPHPRRHNADKQNGRRSPRHFSPRPH
jgi:hypothetical protein